MPIMKAVEVEPRTAGRDEAGGFHAGRVVWFFVLAYGFSWVWVIPWAATGNTVHQGVGWPTHFPSLLGPMLAAFAVTACTTGRAGVRDLLARMVRWRIGWQWWLAVASPLAFFFGVLAVMAAAGADMPATSDFARFSGLPEGLGVVGVALILTLVNGFGEETGWRGYALPQLERRFSPLAATVIIAILWAGWHLPQFFLLRSYQDFSVGMLPVFVFGLTCGAVVWTWVYNRTGSILAVALWHGIYNFTGATKAATGGGGAIASAMWTYVVANAVVLLVLERRARRAGRPSILAPR
ncbi:MAG: CPBP family intramembrane glutamic endopeptidase [Acidimicrobiia bacterium]